MKLGYFQCILIIFFTVGCRPAQQAPAHELIILAELADQAHDFKYTEKILKMAYEKSQNESLREQAGLYLKRITGRKAALEREISEISYSIKFSQTRGIIHRLYYKLAYLQEMSGNDRDAEKNLSICLDLKPSSVYCHMLLSQIYEQRNDTARAQEHRQKAFESGGDNIAEILFVQALQSLRLGRKEEFMKLQNQLAGRQEKYFKALQVAARVSEKNYFEVEND